jgi:hypothetical protein
MFTFQDISTQLEKWLPVEKVKFDLQKFLFSQNTVQATEVELESKVLIVSRDVEIIVISYVLQHGFFEGESSHIRVIAGLGKTKNVYGIAVPELCFARIYYSKTLELQSVDFYEQITS